MQLNLYNLIICIREHYTKSSLVHTFARFMNLLDERKDEKKTGGDGNTEGGEKAKKKAKKGKEDGGGEVKPTNRSLDTSFLSAFLWVRSKMMDSYNGEPVFGAEERQQMAELNRTEVGPGSIPNHIITELGSEFFIPLDRAVQIVKLVLNFLAPRKLSTYSRQIEYNARLLNKEGRVTNPDGARMVIRSAMRNNMLNKKKKKGKKKGDDEQQKDNEKEKRGNSDDKGAEGEEDTPPEEEFQIVVNMYDAMALVMEILRIRIHHMEDQLKRLFIEGDDNGDGVLSFEEFNTLLQRIAPQFSDRRILRMFREALTSGKESTFAIEKSVFAVVCKSNGLVKLVDTVSLDKEYEDLKLLQDLEQDEAEVEAEPEAEVKEETEETEEGGGVGGGERDAQD